MRRTFAPGSEWLYAKLYTGTATADRVLRDVLAPLVREALGSGWAGRVRSMNRIGGGKANREAVDGCAEGMGGEHVGWSVFGLPVPVASGERGAECVGF